MPKLLFFSGLFGFFFSLHSSRNKFKAHSNKTTTTIYDVDFVDLLPSPGVTVKSSSGAIKIVQATIHTHSCIHSCTHIQMCLCVFLFDGFHIFSRNLRKRNRNKLRQHRKRGKFLWLSYLRHFAFIIVNVSPECIGWKSAKSEPRTDKGKSINPFL